MTLGSIIAARETSLVARHRVLVSFDAAIRVHQASLGFPAEGEVRCGNNLDEVHKVKVGVVSLLLSIVQGIKVVVGPERATRLLGH